MIQNHANDFHYWSWNKNANKWSIWAYRREIDISSSQTCAFICNYDPECEYYVFWNNDECCLGKFSHTTGSQFSTSDETVYFKSGTIESVTSGAEPFPVSDFYDPKNGDENDPEKGIMTYTYWRRNLYQWVQDNYRE